MNHQTCAVVVTYNPTDLEIVNIGNLSKIVDYLIVYDNSESIAASKFSLKSNTTIIATGENVGIAKALNEGVRTAFDTGYKKVFLFDQDSKIDKKFIAEMMVFSNETHAALWAPNYYDENANEFGDFIIFGFFWRQKVKCGDKKSMFTDFAITSGSLVDADVWMRLGGVNDGYFIDHVDLEYCLRLKKNGYNIAVKCTTIMHHAVGCATLHNFLGKKVKTSNHSALRRYYISRNYLLLLKSYKMPSIAAVYLLYLTKVFLFIPLFEREKLKKIALSLKGAWHGIIGKNGKLS